MKVIIEDNYSKTLKVGDMLIHEDVLYVVLERRDSKYCYSIGRVDREKVSSVMCSNDLEDLTEQANKYNYVIYSQDEYELVLRRKK